MRWLLLVMMVACTPAFNPRMSERCVQNLDFCFDRLHRRCPEGWDTYTTSSHWGNPNGPDYSQVATGDLMVGSYSMYGGSRPWYALERERADWIYYSATVECKVQGRDRETGN